MSFRTDYQSVTNFLARQLSENQSTVARLKDDIQALRQNHESFLQDAKVRIGECRALDLETGGVMTSIRRLWKQIDLSEEGEEEVSAVSRQDDSGGGGAAFFSKYAAEQGTGTVVLDDDSSDLTTYLNSMCGNGNRHRHEEEGEEEEDGGSADPFERLLRENEALARELKTKRRTIDVLAQRLSECAVGTGRGGSTPSATLLPCFLPRSTCLCRTAGDDAKEASSSSSASISAPTAKAKRRIRFLLAKLEGKVRENQLLVQKMERYRGTDEDHARLLEENRRLKERLSSSLRHRNGLEAEIQRGYQTIKHHEEERKRLQQKIKEMEKALKGEVTTTIPLSRPATGRSIWCNGLPQTSQSEH